MLKKIFYSFYVLASVVAMILASNGIVDIALPLINFPDTIAVVLGVSLLLVLLLLLLLFMYASAKFIDKHILN